MESATWCRTPATSSAASRLRPEVSKNSSTALSSNEGELARSITTCVPAMASLRPSPVRLLTPVLGEAATTSWPRWRRIATVFEPIRPVPPIATIFIVYLLVRSPLAGVCAPQDPKAYSLRSRKVVAIQVHHLGPRRDEVLDELRLRIRASVDLRQGPELGVGTEEEIDARAGPLECALGAIAPFEHVLGVRCCLPLRAHVEQVHEEVVGQRFRPLGKDTVCRLSDVGVQDTQATNEHRHLGRGQRQQLRPIDQQLLGRYGVLAPEVVSEAIHDRLEDGERLHIGLLLRGIHATRREGHRHGVTATLRRLLHACTT